MKAKKVKQCGRVLGCLCALFVYLGFIAICGAVAYGVIKLLALWFGLSIGIVAIIAVVSAVVFGVAWGLLKSIFSSESKN